MDYRQLGGSGLKVPVLSLGTGTFGGGGELFKAWGETDVAEAKRLIDVCLEAGLNMFDSADIYSQGMAEEILGEAVKGRRDQLLISTKATFRAGNGPNDVGSSRFHLLKSVDGCLRRLKTDYIDLFQLHGFDAVAPVEETLNTLDDLVLRGKDSLHRLLEFFRLALDEVTGSLRPLWLAPLCRSPGLLLPRRSRLRAGTDAARRRSKSGGRRVEPARLGTPHRQDSPRPAIAREHPPAKQTEPRHRPARFGRACLQRG